MATTGRAHRSCPFLSLRRLHNEAKKLKAGLAAVRRWIPACTHVRPSAWIEYKGAQTRRCNLTEERMVVPPTSRWCLLHRYHITLNCEILSYLIVLKVFKLRLSRKNYPFLPCMVVTVILFQLKFLEIIRSFDQYGRVPSQVT